MQHHKHNLPQHIFVTGIGTDVGKTIVSAVLTEALQADYWKPVQAGYADGTDSILVKELISNAQSVIHPESYLLKVASVPSFSAEQEGVAIEADKMSIPETNNRLIIEGAGGLMVHLGKGFLVIDLIERLKTPVMLVSENYLGSINHTLLSIEALRSRNIHILGIIYNGDHSPHMRDLIYQTSGIHEIGSVERGHKMDKEFIREQAAKLGVDMAKYFTL
ncbi:MAG: ATP-dependent dethiobiotin synthetase BioD [Bacteroidetes bacterium]|nr:ATP-dependent dethiobiotin synthetase BioD [Bacteroidota bacterium]